MASAHGDATNLHARISGPRPRLQTSVELELPAYAIAFQRVQRISPCSTQFSNSAGPGHELAAAMPMPFDPVPVLPSANASISSVPASSPVQAGFAHRRIAGDGSSEYGLRPKPRILRTIGRRNAAGLSTVMTFRGRASRKRSLTAGGPGSGGRIEPVGVAGVVQFDGTLAADRSFCPAVVLSCSASSHVSHGIKRPRGSPVGTPGRVPPFRETGAWAPRFPGVLHRRIDDMRARSRILFPAHGDFPCAAAAVPPYAGARTAGLPAIPREPISLRH